MLQAQSLVGEQLCGFFILLKTVFHTEVYELLTALWGVMAYQLAPGNLSFLEENKIAFSQKLKECGFLRDLSDATAIVENPYESEDEI